MNMSEIMKKPKWMDEPSTYGPHPDVTYYIGQQILNKFYNQSVGYGSLKTDYIPEELKEKNWKPERIKITGTHYDEFGNQYEVTLGYRDFVRSYNDYTSYDEALEDGICYCLVRL